jgi:D-alanine-D-alanine ligase
VIVKPATLGSSVGIKKADDSTELEEAISLAGSFAEKIIVEKAIVNLMEINCSVLGDNENAVVSACEEPLSSEEILSYNDKYANKSGAKGMSVAKRKLPAQISKEMENQIKELALKTFASIGCNGVSRIDFLVDVGDNQKIYINEINTIPGSLSFYLWEAVGKDFTKLLSEMIDLGFKRQRERGNLMFTYDSNIFSLEGTGGIKGIKGSKVN